MSVESAINKVVYAASGLSTYTIPFLFTENEHIKLFINDEEKTLDTHYSVAGKNNPSGGTLTIIGTPPSGGVSVVILREVPIKQTASFVEGGAFQAKVIEGLYDKLTFIDQQINEQLSRSVKFPLTSSVNPNMTGTVAPRTIIVVNADGDGLEVGPNIDTYTASLDSKVTAAQNAQTASENAKTASEAARDASITAKTASEAAATLAQEWANKIGAPVSGGEFSAKKYAQDAAQSAIDAANIADPGYTIFNSTISSGGIIPIASKNLQRHRVKGDVGDITLSTTPFGNTNLLDGMIVRLFGSDATKKVSINESDIDYGVILNGDCEIPYRGIIEFEYDLINKRWIECFRSF